jgi:hypothetical protein
MSDARKRVLKRAFKGLVAVVLGAAATAATSDTFREFLGDSDFAVVLYAAAVPAVLAVQKAWADRSK